ncbi:14852_t:CDS:2 [Racocetra persica]|uniref:14852_t:CDS:1 n=1 Tax=Racocetra persica TaxID=160502 RepID=A0ACA9KL66_9GLOM|nr:14852_t:CDS:2 [Racocetra persica]
MKVDFTCLILIASLAIATITQALPQGGQNDQADQSMKEQRRNMMLPFDSTPCEASFFYHGGCQKCPSDYFHKFGNCMGFQPMPFMTGIQPLGQPLQGQPPQGQQPQGQPFQTIQELPQTTQELPQTTQEPTETTQEPTETTQELTETTQEPTGTTQEPTGTTQEPEPTQNPTQEPIQKESSSVNKQTVIEPIVIVLHESDPECIHESSVCTDESLPMSVKNDVDDTVDDLEHVDNVD